MALALWVIVCILTGSTLTFGLVVTSLMTLCSKTNTFYDDYKKFLKTTFSKIKYGPMKETTPLLITKMVQIV